MNKKVVNGVFEGGGVKGIALVGALSKLVEDGYEFVALGGSSAGAIVAALYAAGYSTTELRNELEIKDFSEFLGRQGKSNRTKGVLGKLIKGIKFAYGLPSFIKHLGIHDTRALYEWIRRLLKAKGIERFRDLKSELRIVASDLTEKQICIYDRENSPDMFVAEAVRMSSSIPLFFRANQHGESMIVDGGLLSNYPTWLFKESQTKTLGFKLVADKDTEVPRKPTSFFDYIGALVFTMMEAHDRQNASESGWGDTIHISTGKIPTTKFHLSPQEKLFLYDSGYEAASQFLEQ